MHITASQIIDWVSQHAKDAQTQLPLWIRRLCYQAGKIHEISFPAGDSTFRPGWDGLLVTSEENAWVPSGTSCWEIGCDVAVDNKCKSDFLKRTQKTPRAARAVTTFVFVTPRRWLKKDLWAASERLKNEWAGIRVIDADDLEQWLEQFPAIALQFAEQIGLQGAGVESLERRWQQWSTKCRPAITPEAFFTDRSLVKQQLVDAGRTVAAHGARIIMQGDSVEEIAAFAAASFLEQRELADRALVVTTIDGWRYVDMNTQVTIAIAADHEVAAHASTRSDLLIVMPHASHGVERETLKHQVILERPHIYDFERALVSMGMDTSDAKRYALSTGRSWSVLRRQHATEWVIKSPIWTATTDATCLTTLCLLPAWNEENEADRSIVESLAGRTYESFEADLRQLAEADESPVMNIGSVWKVKSMLDLLNLAGGRITRNQVDRFFTISSELLSRTDDRMGDGANAYVDLFYDTARPYSGLLIGSLSDTLIRLAVFGPQIPALRKIQLEARVHRFVEQLLSNANDARWLSLDSHLPALAEAAPEAFLDAVERSLDRADRPIAQMITKSDEEYGGHWHCGLLWAFETIAWSPKLFSRVVMALATLTHVPCGNNSSQTPAATLHSLFRTWLPQTAVDLETRLRVLGILCNRDKDAAFVLVSSLTDNSLTYAMPSARPKWRDDDIGAGNGVHAAEDREMFFTAKRHVFELSEGHPQRLVKLLENTDLRNGADVEEVLRLMSPFGEADATDLDRLILRAVLRRRLNWDWQYDDDHTVDSVERLLKMFDELYLRLCPSNLILRHSWLFSHQSPEIPSRAADLADQSKAIADSRNYAVREILHQLGNTGLDQLIGSSEDAFSIGVTLAGQSARAIDWPNWIATTGGDFSLSSKVSDCISGLLNALPAQSALELIRDALKADGSDSWEADRIARLLCLARSDRETWALATTLGPGVESQYWSLAPLREWHYRWNECSDYVVHQLLAAGRPRTALICCDRSFERIEIQQLFALLQAFADGAERDGPIPQARRIDSALERLESSDAIEEESLIQLELNLFYVFQGMQKPKSKALFKAVTRDPELFAHLIKSACVSDGADSDAKAIDEQTAAIARTAASVLFNCRQVPGACSDGTINSDTFTNFIDAALSQCKDDGRFEKGQYYLGKILANCPADADGSWPCSALKNILERVEYEQMRAGFFISTVNNRGATTRGPWDGGNLEHQLVEKYSQWAEHAQYEHPKVARILGKLSNYYLEDALRQDHSANLRKESY
ncbi:hypothetical protein ACI7YU_18735 [Pseudomonas siliginis]|uniref:hypothetical protein n=1 Tax=Pseudomonas siliginis TaxID=2842346 RepID=UPI0038692362